MKALPILSEQSAENTVYPRTPLEELIASVWSQVLGIGDIGVQDSFFELGGHSTCYTSGLALTGSLSNQIAST